MIEHLIRKLNLQDRVAAPEAEMLRDAVARVDVHEADSEIVREGVEQGASRVLIEGWAGRVKSLASGRRQVTELHLPGDFIDLHSFLTKRLDHSVVALTRCRIAVMPHEALRQINETQPHLTRMLWRTTVIDAAIHRQWLAVLGQLPAVAQIAHLICEIDVRLTRLGLARDHGFDFPLTQEELADCLGMTSVHVNRMVQQLRADGLIEWRRGRMTLLDWPRLARLADFDPAYLGVEECERVALPV